MALRPWVLDDAPDLVSAWADPDVAAETEVPAPADLAAARRWIGGADLRLATGVSLDLVVLAVDGPVAGGGALVGEVGVRSTRLTSGPRRIDVLEVGWWLAPSARGHGRARRAATLLLGWLGEALGHGTVVARIRPGHGASEAIARHVGLVERGPLGPDHRLWSTSLGPSRPA